MTTYIGRIGDMIPVGCVTAAPVTHESRSVVGGGAGTLAPRRVRVYGPGAREWQVSVSVGDFARIATLESLARTQATYGGSYRVIPCDAVNYNLFTPEASESLTGWSDVTRGHRATFDIEVGSAVIPLTIPFVIGGTGHLSALDPRPMSLGFVASGAVGVSPEVPCVKPGTVHGKVWVSGTGTVQLKVWDAVTETPATFSKAFVGSAGVLTRVSISADLAPTAGWMELAVNANGGQAVYVAWPSLAHEEHPYTTGRGCDQAYLSQPSRNPIGAWGGGLESHAYTIMEVGA